MSTLIATRAPTARRVFHDRWCMTRPSFHETAPLQPVLLINAPEALLPIDFTAASRLHYIAEHLRLTCYVRWMNRTGAQARKLALGPARLNVTPLVPCFASLAETSNVDQRARLQCRHARAEARTPLLLRRHLHGNLIDGNDRRTRQDRRGTRSGQRLLEHGRACLQVRQRLIERHDHVGVRRLIDQQLRADKPLDTLELRQQRFEDTDALIGLARMGVKRGDSCVHHGLLCLCVDADWSYSGRFPTRASGVAGMLAVVTAHRHMCQQHPQAATARSQRPRRPPCGAEHMGAEAPSPSGPHHADRLATRRTALALLQRRMHELRPMRRRSCDSYPVASRAHNAWASIKSFRLAASASNWRLTMRTRSGSASLKKPPGSATW